MNMAENSSSDPLRIALELADLTHNLLLHLQEKQLLLLEERISELGSLLGKETLLVKKINRTSAALDTLLRRQKLLSPTGGYSTWLNSIFSQCEPEEQVRLTKWAEETIACQELQLRQQEIMQHSLLYYQRMSRFISGVNDITYQPPEKGKNPPVK